MSFYLHTLFPDLYVEEKRYDTLVLSSGSVQGFMVLGALQYLFDNERLTGVTTFVGTSVGAIIAYLVCIGYTPSEILVSLHITDWLDKIKDFDVSNILKDRGLVSYAYIQEIVEKLTLEKIDRFLTLKQLFDEHKKTLVVSTYNATKSKMEYLSYRNYPDLPCITALRMSSNIPIFFDRFRYFGNFYLDGALGDSFPILVGQEFGKCVLGINILTSAELIRDRPERGFLDYLFKLLHIPMRESIIHKTKIAERSETSDTDIIHLESYSISSVFKFNISKQLRLDMFSFGYQQTKKFFEIKDEGN